MKITGIKAELIKAKELKVGELFSNVGQKYWDKAIEAEDGCVGERIYIRTQAKTPKDQGEVDVFRIIVEEK